MQHHLVCWRLLFWLCLNCLLIAGRCWRNTFLLPIGRRFYEQGASLFSFGNRLVHRYATPRVEKVVFWSCLASLLLLCLALALRIGADGRASNPLAWIILHGGPTLASTVASVGSTILSVKICYWKATGKRPSKRETHHQLAQQAFKGMSLILVVFPLISLFSIRCTNWLISGTTPSPLYYTTVLTVVTLGFNTPIGLLSTWVHTPRILPDNEARAQESQADALVEVLAAIRRNPPDDPQVRAHIREVAQHLLKEMGDAHE